MQQGAELKDAMTDSIDELDGVFTYVVATADSLGMAKDVMAAKPMVLYEDENFVALASEKSRSAASSRMRSTPSTPMRAKCGSGSDNERERKPAMALRTKSHDMGDAHRASFGPHPATFLRARCEENFTYPGAFEVDFNKRAEFDAAKLTPTEINHKIRDLLSKGNGTIVLKNPGAKHGVAVGILNKLNLIIEGSLGYFGVGLIDGPNVRIKGRVGWSCAENMLAGTVIIEKNAGSTFGAAIRGGDLVCMGDVGARMGIDMKGGTIIVGGRAGAFCGFMMQRGRMVILGDAGKNLGDSMYDGTIYVGGKDRGSRRRCGAGRDERARLRMAGAEAETLRPEGAERGQEHDQDRRRQAALELRQSRARREEAHSVTGDRKESIMGKIEEDPGKEERHQGARQVEGSGETGEVGGQTRCASGREEEQEAAFAR